MQKIEAIIAEKVLPVLQAHNGGLELVEVTPKGYAKVKLTGACSACPGAQQTISDVVQAALQEVLPEVKGVILVSQVDDDLIRQALAIIRKGRS